MSDVLSALLAALQSHCATKELTMGSLRFLLSSNSGAQLPPSLRHAVAFRICEEPEALESIVAAARQAPGCCATQSAAFGLLVDLQPSLSDKTLQGVRLRQRLLSAGLADAAVASLCSLTERATTGPTSSPSGRGDAPQPAVAAGWTTVRRALQCVLVFILGTGDDILDSFKAAVHGDTAIAGAVGAALAQAIVMEVKNTCQTKPTSLSVHHVSSLMGIVDSLGPTSVADYNPAASRSTLAAYFLAAFVEGGALTTVLAALNGLLGIPPTIFSTRAQMRCLDVLQKSIRDGGLAAKVPDIVAAARLAACRCLTLSAVQRANIGDEVKLTRTSGAVDAVSSNQTGIRRRAISLLNLLRLLPGMPGFSLLPDADAAFSAVYQSIVDPASVGFNSTRKTQGVPLFCSLIESCPAGSTTAARRAEEALRTGVVDVVCKVCSSIRADVSQKCFRWLAGRSHLTARPDFASAGILPGSRRESDLKYRRRRWTHVRHRRGERDHVLSADCTHRCRGTCWFRQRQQQQRQRHWRRPASLARGAGGAGLLADVQSSDFCVQFHRGQFCHHRHRLLFWCRWWFCCCCRRCCCCCRRCCCCCEC